LFSCCVGAAVFVVRFGCSLPVASDLVTGCLLFNIQRLLCYWTNTTGMTHLKITWHIY